MIADGPDEVRKAAREQIRHDVDQIKIMASGGAMSPGDELDTTQYTVDEMRAAVEEARAVGKYVLAHAYSPLRGAQRGPGGRALHRARQPDRRGRRASDIKKAGAYLVPTMVTYEAIWREGKSYGIAEHQLQKINMAREKSVEGLTHAYRAGCKIGSGSDLLGDMQAQRAVELELKGQVMKPMEVLLSATRVNAEIFRMETRSARVEPGKYADLIAVKGNPLKDLARLPEPGQPPPDHEGRRRLQARRMTRAGKSSRAGKAPAAAKPGPVTPATARPPAASGSPAAAGPADFEKLGVFYLGRPYDLRDTKAGDELLLYDSKDLVTHAVCVGMTGSGKTGLCLALLEEAAIDGIPAIVIDPKGDLAQPAAHLPRAAARGLRALDQRGRRAAQGRLARRVRGAAGRDCGRKGLADWGQDGARIRRLRDAADFAIYTPGSNAGPAGLDPQVVRRAARRRSATTPRRSRERIGTTATSLLGLLGIDADPLQSREHILLVDHPRRRAWRAGPRPRPRRR